VKIEKAERLKKLPPYLFKEIDRLKNELEAKGANIINLGVGDPDRPTPKHIIQAGQKGLADPSAHCYPSYSGQPSFREAVAEWYQRRFGVKLDPASQVLALIGSKEAVAHFPLAFVNPGEVVLCPTPAYPVYEVGTIFAEGEVFQMPLRPENGFFPDLGAIPKETARQAKVIWLNYPNNPTSAEATVEQFQGVVDFALEHEVIVCHDAAYTEMTFDGYKAPSFLQTPGAMECALEFHSFSKTYQMTGWRVGMAVGNAALVAGLSDIKSNVDSGVCQAIQEAAVAALKTPDKDLIENHAVYADRRRVAVEGLERLGLTVWSSRATFYVWARVPAGLTSAQWAARLIEEAQVVITPGNGFGGGGEGWFRVALSVPKDRVAEAVDRMGRLAL